jgi:hypothetical protein
VKTCEDISIAQRVFNNLNKDIRGYLLHLVENIGKPRTYYFHSYILDEHFGLIFFNAILGGAFGSSIFRTSKSYLSKMIYRASCVPNSMNCDSDATVQDS